MLEKEFGIINDNLHNIGYTMCNIEEGFGHLYEIIDKMHNKLDDLEREIISMKLNSYNNAGSNHETSQESYVTLKKSC